MLCRYSRHVLLSEIGDKGQQRLSATRAAVVGVGGLGSPVLYYLASAGVGQITIIDSDTVDSSNLNRQFIHFEADIGREKARSAREKLEQYNRDIQIHATAVALDDDNAREYLRGHDIVVSCVDSKKTRRLINSVCMSANTPLIDGGVQGFEGYVLTVLPGVTPCYQCIFPSKGNDEDTDGVGVLGAATGVLGSMMATEAIKHIAGISMHAHFYFVDLLSNRITPIRAKRAPDCPACGSQ